MLIISWRRTLWILKPGKWEASMCTYMSCHTRRWNLRSSSHKILSLKYKHTQFSSRSTLFSQYFIWK
jgi:hypothetical protein